MKKNLVIFLALFFALFTANAQAGQGGFIGLDAMWSHSYHEYRIRNFGEQSDIIPESFFLVSQDGTSITGDGIGVSANTGFRVDVNNYYLAPELFYDFLHNVSSDPFASIHPNEVQDSLEFRHRFGGRMNVGINIIGGLNFFVNAGAANIYFIQNAPSVSLSRSGNKWAPIYGAGFMYDVSYNMSFKLAYDRQEFNIPYVFTGLRDQVKLETIKVGMVYSF